MIYPKYNLLSTSLFTIPVLYGFYNKKYLLSTTSLISMMVSLNYLRNPTSEKRKMTDLIVSKIAGALYFVYGYNNVNNIIFRVFGFTNGFFMISLYNISCILYELKSNTWEYYHMMFHISMVIGKMIVLSN